MQDSQHVKLNIVSQFLQYNENKKYNCSGPPAFKSQRVGMGRMQGTATAANAAPQNSSN